MGKRNIKIRLIIIILLFLISNVFIFNKSIDKVNAETSLEPRFVAIDSTGLDDGVILVDTKTNIEYVLLSRITSTHAVTMSITVLYDIDGRPLIWKPEGE